MTIDSYIQNIAKRYALGNATEHTFRGDLQTLIESLAPDVAATNEPQRIECGAPDYVVSRKEIPLGYIEAKDWILSAQREKLRKQRDYTAFISKIAYRPFDDQFTILNSAVCDRPRTEILDHVLNKDNLCLLASKQQATSGFRHCFISKLPANDCVMSTTSREANQIFPLYLYPDNNAQQTLDGRTERVPNLTSEIVDKIADAIGLAFTNEKEETDDTFAPIDILDYIYAVLHRPSYREKCKEFLKIDFPRVPYPKDAATFWELVKLGGELRQIHLLESRQVEQFITQYPENGDNIVVKPRFVPFPPQVGSTGIGRVFINDSQYFNTVPEIAWDFHIGGYQPAQKWLKDRKGRELSFDDIQHYQKIIIALVETDRIMKEIDKIGF